MNIWSFLKDKLATTIPALLMVVLDSQGSSPGRQGFKMIVAKDGTIFGSIGGGIMEHKLVEKARDMLQKGATQSFTKIQIHRKDSPVNQSGMICSGQQIIVLFPIPFAFKNQIQSALDSSTNQTLHLDPQSIRLFENQNQIPPFEFYFKSEKDWQYQELITHQETIHIIGGGHVGLAFSEIMAYLGFRVYIYDNRPNLSTLELNNFADQKKILDYSQIGKTISSHPHHYVVIMTFGYRTDKSVLVQLLEKKYKYLGMMGSAAKIKQLYAELKAEGFSEKQLGKVHAPIGLPIHSKTPQEIAVSIAAQIIQIKNLMH